MFNLFIFLLFKIEIFFLQKLKLTKKFFNTVCHKNELQFFTLSFIQHTFCFLYLMQFFFSTLTLFVSFRFLWFFSFFAIFFLLCTLCFRKTQRLLFFLFLLFLHPPNGVARLAFFFWYDKIVLFWLFRYKHTIFNENGLVKSKILNILCLNYLFAILILELY